MLGSSAAERRDAAHFMKIVAGKGESKDDQN